MKTENASCKSQLFLVFSPLVKLNSSWKKKSEQKWTNKKIKMRASEGTSTAGNPDCVKASGLNWILPVPRLRRKNNQKRMKKVRMKERANKQEPLLWAARRRGMRLEVYMCSLPLNQGIGWINNTIDIPVMRSRCAIHNYFIVAVMRALALPMCPAQTGRPLQTLGPSGKR